MFSTSYVAWVLNLESGVLQLVSQHSTSLALQLQKSMLVKQEFSSMQDSSESLPSMNSM